MKRIVYYLMKCAILDINGGGGGGGQNFDKIVNGDLTTHIS